MKWYSAEDYGSCSLIPGITISAIRCQSAECDAIHGIAITVNWLFWAVGFAWVKGGDR